MNLGDQLSVIRLSLFCWVFVFSSIYANEGEFLIQNKLQDTAKTAPVIGALDIFFPAPVVVGSSRSEYDIAKRIQDKKRLFLQCYTNHITRFDDLAFRIRFEIVILPNGEVESVQVISRGTKNQTMINCFRSVFRQIIFDADDSGQKTLVQQSLVFRIIR